ncbi:hypothetical protein LR69_02419 [Geobacillus sp. BCO2]|nr:hypothetical protein LR69_02419 [Geobacillus sp. BCO2]
MKQLDRADAGQHAPRLNEAGRALKQRQIDMQNGVFQLFFVRFPVSVRRRAAFMTYFLNTPGRLVKKRPRNSNAPVFLDGKHSGHIGLGKRRERQLRRFEKQLGHHLKRALKPFRIWQSLNFNPHVHHLFCQTSFSVLNGCFLRQAEECTFRRLYRNGSCL